MPDDDLKELYTYTDLAVLKRIELLLKEHNIQYLNRSYEDMAYDGLFTLTNGKGKLFVFKKDYNQALAILKSIELL